LCLEPVQVLQDPVRFVNHLVTVYEDGYPTLAGQLLHFEPVAPEKRDADLVELEAS
jgi:hypothetical protein